MENNAKKSFFFGCEKVSLVICFLSRSTDSRLVFLESWKKTKKRDVETGVTW